MRLGALALLVFSAPAFADPAERLEASGFIGVGYFGDDIGLGGALQPEQRPQTAPTFGGRLTYIALRTGEDSIRLDVGVEAELAFTASWTGYGFDGARPSYFAPVFGYRANVIARLGSGWLQPHLLGGVGGATVASASPYMDKETDPVLVVGAGLTFPVGDRWQLRFDGRLDRTDARDGGMTNAFEAHMSIGSRFGLAHKPEPSPPVIDVIADHTPEPPPVKDSDGDGLPDNLDACPAQPEAVNGIDDQDGCPEPDPDGDALVGAADKCPDRAEDFDKFEDEDGCPDDDNDKDGVVDAKDACPNEAENKNGIADDDGCADAVPPAVVAALAVASTVKFGKGSARLASAAKATLDKALAAILNNPRLKITIVAHPERAGEGPTAIARKRADNVKWYLTEQGVAAGNLTTTVGDVATAKGPMLELVITAP